MRVYSDYSDQVLLEMIAMDDQRAFAELYRRYWDKMYWTAFKRLGNAYEAEEAVQEIFTKLWIRRKQVKLSTNISSYFAVAVKYQAINSLAKIYIRERYRQEHSHIKPTSDNPTEAWLTEKELIERLEATVSALPEKCKLVFEMSRKEGKSNKQIAQILRLAEKTVEAHISKALLHLRNNLTNLFWSIISILPTAFI